MEGSTSTPSSGNTSSTASTTSQAKTNAMLAWIFAPITSFVWKDDANSFVKAHARESLYFGIANIVLSIVLYLLQALFFGLLFSGTGFSFLGFAGFTSLLFSLLWLAFWVFSFVPRVIGVVKANDMQTWEFPVVTNLVKRFIKL